MRSQKPDRDQSAQKSHSDWNVPTIETNQHWRGEISGWEFDFIDHGNILTVYFFSSKI